MSSASAMMALMRERFTVPVLPEAEAGHARKLVTARSGGGVKVLDPVLEDNPRNDLWQALSEGEQWQKKLPRRQTQMTHLMGR